MSKIYVVYWSASGNTKAMAEAIGNGITAEGCEAQVIEVGNISSDILKNEAVFALGCPAMGAEQLEEDEMEPFVTEVDAFASGKKIGLFGSYGWGGGEWMSDWVERMNAAGAEVIGNSGIICQDTPDNDALEQCEKLGKKLVELKK